MDSSTREQHGSAVNTPFFRYGVTVAAVVLAGAVRWLLDPLLGDHLPFATFFVAVAVASWAGGLRAGLLATGLGFVLAAFLFVPPRLSVVGTSGPHLIGLAMYFVVCLTFAGFGEAMRVGRPRSAVKPTWGGDGRHGQFWLGDTLVKEFRQPAKRQEAILDTFEAAGWPERVDALGRLGSNSAALGDAVHGLNSHHATPGVMRFRRDGFGAGIL